MKMTHQKKIIPQELVIDLALSREWYITSGEAGKPLFLAYGKYESFNFSNEIFAEATLQEANFSGANLERVNAVRSIANGVCLKNATLTASDWTKAEMAEADFSETQANEVLFVKTNLRDTDFYQADLQDSDFTQSICIGADFTKARLKGSNFTKSILNGACFQNADLSQVILNGCHLNEDTIFFGAIGFETIKLDYLLVSGQRLDFDLARNYLENLISNRS